MKYIRILSLFCLTLLSYASYGQGAEIKSGIVYYFTRYVEWPASKQSGDFVINVVGNDEITSHLQTMSKAKSLGSRQIVVREVGSVSDAKNCHILILAGDKLDQFNTAALTAENNNFLLVTDAQGYGKKGAGINFITKNGKPSYEINQTSVNKCGLKISSKLTTLGTVIE
ncbi:MAG: YfiR family protein [Cyclobacteriaceae bacterium]